MLILIGIQAEAGNFRTERDSRNNVEQIIREGLRPGDLFKVKVRGHHVPIGPQPFALVVTGAFDVDEVCCPWGSSSFSSSAFRS